MSDADKYESDVPTTEEVRQHWATNEYGYIHPDGLKDFDAWLNEERAKAWDDCDRQYIEWEQSVRFKPPINPYREGVE